MVDALEDGVVSEPVEMKRYFVTIRRDELARWEASGNDWSVETISDWELAEYLPFY